MTAQGSMQEQLRAAIAKDGRSINQLHKDAAIGLGPLQRFVARKHGCTVTTAEKLVAALGLVLVLKPARKGR
jgi:hypothetical protein